MTRIAAGSAHAVALAADGTLWAWGQNDYGQLGDGTATRRVAAVLVPSLSRVAAISAGAYHTLGLLADGTVRAWGSNTSGQLGDGTTTTRSAPQLVPGLAGVVAVAAGGSHALALTGDGTVWAWGSNGAGQVGDGTTAMRLTPTAISGAGMAWRLPPPTLSVASGTFSSPFEVTVTSPDLTAALHYTTTGVEPTEADPVVVSGGTMTIGRTLTLKVRAWTPSLGASLTATGTYVFNYGTLAAPVASPAGGNYPSPQTVTLSAAPGATIRYTMDGTDPTADSPPYLAPLTLGAAATLKARAFQADWTMSAVLTEPYTWADTTPPTITAVVSPPPTAAGWHTAAVEVTFVCADETEIAACPDSTWVTQDGAGQVVTGEAVDAAGNRATASVTVNLDRTPPRLTVFSPEPDDVVGAGTTVVTVRGSVTDVTSGLASLTCGSGTATPVGPAYACDAVVTAGANLLRIETHDAAGHVAVREVLVTVGGPLTPPPAALAVAPAVMTLVAGETRGLQAIDDRGRLIPDATWSVADPTVADVTVTGTDPVLHALAAGLTTVTATWAGLTAEATVTVWAAGAALPAGTTVWALPGTAPAQGRVLPAFPVEPAAEGDPAAFFFLDESSTPRVQGVARDGRLQWQRTMGGPLLQAAADAGGGLVTLQGQRFTTTMVEGALQRRDGLTGTVTWEYLPTQDAGGYEAALSEVALHPDGTVYVTETRDTATDLVALDGRTGAVRHRIVLGASYFERWVDGVRDVAGFFPAEATAPLVRADGSVAVVVYTRTTIGAWRTINCPGPICHDQSDTVETLEHVALSDTGAVTRRALTPGGVDFTYRHLIRLLPDGGDGFLLVSRTPVVGASGTFDVGEIHHVAATGTLSGGVSVGTDTPQVVLGTDAAYALAPGWYTGPGAPPAAPPDAQVTTFDPTTGAALATERLIDGLAWRLAFAPAGGGVFLAGPQGTMSVGAPPLPVSLLYPTYAGGGTWVGWRGGPAMVAEEEVMPAGTAWAYGAGDQWQANRERCRCMPSIDDAPLAVPVTFVVLQGTFSAVEHDWFASAVAQWNEAIRAVKPAITLNVAPSPVAGHRNVVVSLDPGLAWAGAAWRGSGDWWIKINPAEYEVSQGDLLPDYLKELYLHELGHIAGFGHVDCLRTDSIMGVEDAAGSYAGRATCLLAGDLCAVRFLYRERE